MARNAIRLMSVVAAGSLLTAACAKSDRTADDTTTVPTSASATTPPGDSASRPAAGAASATDPSQFSDANILAKEIAGDSAEVAISGVAEQMATSPAVKAYAKKLASDHGKGLKEVQTVATKASITPQPPAGDTTAQETSHVVQRLQGMTKGADFDSAFVNHEIEDHQQDIADVKAMQSAAKDPQVKALLDKTLPELQKHLDMAQKLAKGGSKKP